LNKEEQSFLITVEQLQYFPSQLAQAKSLAVLNTPLSITWSTPLISGLVISQQEINWSPIASEPIAISISRTPKVKVNIPFVIELSITNLSADKMDLTIIVPSTNNNVQNINAYSSDLLRDYFKYLETDEPLICTEKSTALGVLTAKNYY